jgi:hypothetical protein
MLERLETYLGLALHARDGELGHADDVAFDQ